MSKQYEKSKECKLNQNKFDLELLKNEIKMKYLL